MFARRIPLLPLLLVMLGACARPHVSTGPRFAGLAGASVYVRSDLPDAFAGGRELRVPRLRSRVAAELGRARVPVREGEGGEAGLALELAGMRLSEDDYAVWVRVSLAELVSFERGSGLPLMVDTWVRTGKARVRGSDTAELWREIDRLTAEFAREYHAANPPR
jgi:hypothetical protein